MTTTPAVVRAEEAEDLDVGSSTLHLLLDASSTGGALTSHRVRLRAGALGASPHRHESASELFYVIDGEVDLLSGDRTFAAGAGTLVVVPPGSPHAFAATADGDADLLVVATPGIERFPFFRTVAAVMRGDLPPEALADQERYDNHGEHSPVWDRFRTRRTDREQEQR